MDKKMSKEQKEEVNYYTQMILSISDTSIFSKMGISYCASNFSTLNPQK